MSNNENSVDIQQENSVESSNVLHPPIKHSTTSILRGYSPEPNMASIGSASVAASPHKMTAAEAAGLIGRSYGIKPSAGGNNPTGPLNQRQ